MKYNKIYIKKFRNLRDIEFNLGKKITVISGINGIGKSSILSLLSSSTGTSDKRLSTSSKFHPEFNDFFTISDSEEISSYLMYVEFDKSITIDGKDYPITKRIGFRDDRNSDRGIRVNPRNSNTINMIKAGLKTPTQSKFNDELKKIGITESKRIQTPTIYVSLSRLFPVGETNIKTELLDKRTNFYKKGSLTYYTE
ncbi:MAG: AAA family ATPase, partial [Ligilactobacillus sp.]|nr:AAA family ATPase [Ligilactobacillus sp.]